MPNSLIDIYSRHGHFVERYKTGQFNRLESFLKRAQSRLRDELLKTNTVISQNRIEAKLDAVELIMKSELEDFADSFNEQLRLFAVSEAEFGAKSLAMFGNFEPTVPTIDKLFAAISARPFNNILLKDYLNKFTRDQSELVKNAVSLGFFEGKTTPEIVREISGTKALKFRDGILNITRNSASRMVRTAINHVASVAKDKLWQDNDDLVPYYEWLSTLDSRTSITCQSLDGQIFKTGKGKVPPAHLNCRSTTVPILEGEFTIKNGKVIKNPSNFTRSSTDGSVSSDLNYNDWLKKQSKQFKIEALGETRAKLFEKGGLSVDKFVDRLDAPLTLDQLKSKFPMAWEDAGI